MNNLSAYINRERLCDLFCRLVAIDSPSYGERAMADFIQAELADLGLHAVEDDAALRLHGTAGNLTVFVPGDPALEPVLLAAHMDTVAPACGKRAVLQPDGTITSAGDTVLGADDLATVAQLLELLRVLKEHQLPHAPLEVIFFAAEEPYCVGSRGYDFSAHKATTAFIGDLEGAPGLAALRAPTILSFRITVHGKASHAGFAPEKGIHAVQAAADALSRLPLGRLDSETSLGIGTIQGGLASNIVPELCTLEGEIRGYDDGKVHAALELVRSTFTACAEQRGATVDLYEEQRVTAYSVPPASPICARFSAACAALGITPTFCDTFGGSDANATARAGIPSLVISNAMHRVHSTGEYTHADELAATAALFLQLVSPQT